jgi:pimeloyl-ACP methyl ester carboxylesterase
MSGSTSVDARGPIAAIAACACVAVVGCALWQVAEDQKKDAAVVRLRGTVSAVETGHGALVVVLTRRPAPDQPEDAIVDYFTRETDGVFYFAIVEPGVYSVAAFQDSDGDLTYDPGEPGLNSSDATTFELSSGDTREGIELVIRPDDRIPTEDGEGYDIRAWIDEIAATGTATTSRHLAALADVVDLAEPRFGSENGRRGLWEAWDFVYDGLQGVYFLEPYDPNRTPVLFVHGISGYPQEFSALIEHLDCERYQPWFFFYASGEHLYRSAELLVQLVQDLRLDYGFDRMVVVAHSMGGLLSRDFLLQYQDTTGRDTISTFISISTPWGGHAAADVGVERSPVVVYTWNEMATKGEYIRTLFYEDPATQKVPRRLPEHTTHHLIFGFVDRSSSDGVVAIGSELHPPAQAQAATIYGVKANHTEILRHELTIERVTALLTNASR